MEVHFHLPTRDIHIGGLVIVKAGKNRVGGGRSRELVDLRAQRLNLRLGFLKRRRQFVVLPVGQLELIPRMMKLPYFFFHGLDLDAEFFQLECLFVVLFHRA